MTDRLLGLDPTTVTGDGALLVLARAAIRVAAPLAVLLTIGFWAVSGTAAGVTALVSAVVLLGLHVGSARLGARVARRDARMVPVVTMLGLLVRLAVYGLLIVLLDDVSGVDVPALATTVIGLTLAILLVETSVVARYSKFWWAAPTETADAVDEKEPA